MHVHIQNQMFTGCSRVSVAPFAVPPKKSDPALQPHRAFSQGCLVLEWMSVVADGSRGEEAGQPVMDAYKVGTNIFQDFQRQQDA